MVEIAAWLRGLGLERYEDSFRANEIDAEILPTLTAEDLKDLGVTIVGHRRKILNAISGLDVPEPGASAEPPSSPPAGPVKATPARDAERRQLTVMFCDLVGSTELSARLDPEEMRDVIRAYQNTVAGEIARYDGHVAKFMGDGVIAYFGYPHAHEEDAERAILSALSIVRAIPQLKLDAVSRVQVRIGIATGQVVVGDLIGEGAAQEEAVVGDTPNLAARLQELASPDSIVISATTRNLVGNAFDCADLGRVSLKGLSEPEQVWQVNSERSLESRFKARTGGLTTFVGRDHEVGLLLERWQQAKDGEGQVVLLSGEAGIGKSRILETLRDVVSGEEHVHLRYQCSPYHTNSALYPVIGQLEHAAGFVADDSFETKLTKLEQLLDPTTERLDKVMPLVGSLLSIPTDDRYPPHGLTPQQQKSRTLNVLVQQLATLAQQCPVLFLFEDAHWIDPTTLELLEMMVEHIASQRVFILITHRPEFQAPWLRYGHVSSLALNRLSRAKCSEMVLDLTDGKPLPDEVLDQMIAKTDGVPLFVEELTKTVLDAGLLRETQDQFELVGPLPPLAIPSTLQDSLMARLDRLAPVKEVAQFGAVIGREFSHRLLVAVMTLSDDKLNDMLGQLIKSELVFRRGTGTDAIYVFKHALVRDAAYESLLKAKRAMVHARIAENLKGLYPELVAQQPEVLAHHYGEAGLTAESIRQWIDAAKRSTERSAHVEALAQLDRALLLLDSLPREIEHARYGLDIQTIRAGALLATRGYLDSETIDAFERARALCRELNEPPEVYQVFRGLCSIETMKGNLSAALALAEESLRFAEAQDDSAPISLGHRLIGQCRFMMGEFLQARTHVENAIDIYEPARHRESAAIYGLDLRTGAAQILGLTLCLLGYPEQALRVSQNAIRDARQLGSVFSLAVALEWANPMYMFRGEHDVACQNAEELLQLANEHELDEYVEIATINRSLALAHREPADLEAVAQLKRQIVSYQDRYGEFFIPYTLGSLAKATGAAGRVDEALDLIENSVVGAQQSEQHWNDAELYRLRGTLLLLDNAKKPSTDAAEQCFERALAIARSQQARWLELRAANSLARLWWNQGKVAKARELLAPLYNWFSEGFETSDLKNARALLNELE